MCMGKYICVCMYVCVFALTGSYVLIFIFIISIMIMIMFEKIEIEFEDDLCATLSPLPSRRGAS